MYKFEVTCVFMTKTVEQAEHIRKFFDDAQALMTCENSSFSSTAISEVNAKPEMPEWDAIVFSLETEALTVLEALKGVIHNYGVTTVQDLNDFAGLSGRFIDTKWGWKDLDEVKVKSVEAPMGVIGYSLDLPTPEFIEHITRSSHV